jgi:hypothetical protein
MTCFVDVHRAQRKLPKLGYESNNFCFHLFFAVALRILSYGHCGAVLSISVSSRGLRNNSRINAVNMMIDPSSGILLDVGEDMILPLKAINIIIGKKHGLDSHTNRRHCSEQLSEGKNRECQL